MPTIVSDLNLPFVHSNLYETNLTKYEQIDNNLKIAKDCWIASFGFGYVIYEQKHIKAILADKRWHNALAFYAGINSPDDTDESKYYKKRRSAILINLEGDDHSRLKNLISPIFQLKNISYLKPFIHWTANSVIDKLLGAKEFDIQKELFHNYPVYVIAQLIGLPIKDINIFNAWTEAGFRSFNLNTKEEIDDTRVQQKIIDEYLLNLIEERRVNPKNDFITKLIQAEEGSDILNSDEIIMILEALITSGIDTTRNQLGLCLSYFDKNPEKWQLAIQNKDIMNKMLEEAMAYDGVIRNLGRVASEDIVYNDILFPKGTLVTPALTVSNINEPNNPFLTFGFGIHHCLGMALARLEIQEIFSILAQRMPNFKIKSVEYKSTTDTIWGVKSIVVEIK
jgi:cytochrome P450